MAKIRQNDFIDTVNEVITGAKEAGVVHLHAEGAFLNGRKIRIHGKDHFHFGTTGYLGLEQDPRLKKAAIDAIHNYGTQFPLSKSYISHPLYADLEERVEAMYSKPIIITKNSTLGHIAVIPSIVGDEDSVILDHQVHWSVQNATQALKLRGIPVEMIRHSSLFMLEERIKKLRSKCRKIWYMADGVYSMYGDYAPIDDLIVLMNKYPQLHLYFDDVHGMSWNGRNGTGYVTSILKELPDNIVLISTLSKTFGASGAVAVCPDKKLHTRVKTFGGPLTFSAQLEPASVAAAIASADIHLSDEIYELQAELQERINFFNQLLEQTELPLINRNNSPVFYIGTGMPISGYNFVQRLLKENFYVNLGIYPAVPVKNTGVRITISRHNTLGDIEELVKAMEYHYNTALTETGTSLSKVRRAFKMPVREVSKNSSAEIGLSCNVEDSIRNINRKEWNSMFAGKGILDWDGQIFLEDSFCNNIKKEHNWKFRYIIIKDRNNVPVIGTSLSYALWKEDILASASTSSKIEEQRKEDPYYLTSFVLSTGSLFSEGDHIYVNEDHPDLDRALEVFLDKLEILDQQHFNSSMIVLRDFHIRNSLNTFLHNRGFIKANMPDSCIFSDFSWNSKEQYLKILSKRSRRHFIKDIQPFEDKLELVVSEQVEENMTIMFQDLYDNVRRNNPGLNTFPFPEKVFRQMNENPNFEFLMLYLKKEFSNNHEDHLVGIMFCYKNSRSTFVPVFVGMDYTYAREFNVYRLLLYYTILRAKDLGYHRIDFGLTASFEKRKLGAIVIPKVCYVQAKDNFTMELIETMQNNN